MKQRLEKIPNLFIKQGTTEDLIIENDRVIGVETQEGIAYLGKTVILSAGTFMRGMIHIGTTILLAEEPAINPPWDFLQRWKKLD